MLSFDVLTGNNNSLSIEEALTGRISQAVYFNITLYLFK